MSIVKPVDGFFPITSVHRDDLEEKGFDTSNLTDDQMLEMAEMILRKSILEFHRRG